MNFTYPILRALCFVLMFLLSACGDSQKSSADPTLLLSETGGQDSSEVGQPAFSLTDYLGETLTFSIPSEGIVVLEWFNQECPFVKKLYKDGFLQDVQKKYRDKGVQWFLVNSTNTSHRDFLFPDKRKELIESWNLYPEGLLFDEKGLLGSFMKAKTTPHIFIFNKEVLIYSGAIDDAPDTDSDPRKAINFVQMILDELFQGGEPEFKQNRPYGCSIKY